MEGSHQRQSGRASSWTMIVISAVSFLKLYAQLGWRAMCVLLCSCAKAMAYPYGKTAGETVYTAFG